jgi:hypothetical protein
MEKRAENCDGRRELRGWAKGGAQVHKKEAAVTDLCVTAAWVSGNCRVVS